MSSIYPVEPSNVGQIKQEESGSLLYNELIPELDNLKTLFAKLEASGIKTPQDLENSPLFVQIRDALSSIMHTEKQIENAPETDYIDWETAHDSSTFAPMNSTFNDSMFPGTDSLFSGTRKSNQGNNDPLANTLFLLMKNGNDLSVITDSINGFEANPYD